MFGWFKKTNADPVAVKKWRDAVTRMAREPEPFLRGWTPDTIYGRFHMVALVATLAMRRFREQGQEGNALSKAFSEMLFSDFDHSLREHGVGDSSIARRIRKMGEEFYGLASAVDEALEQGGPDKHLAQVIQRNIQQDAEKALELANYVLDLNLRVERVKDALVLEGPDEL
nr:ubiquinol-cytochrome C chaperone family protein [Hyphomonas sp. Mor2]